MRQQPSSTCSYCQCSSIGIRRSSLTFSRGPQYVGGRCLCREVFELAVRASLLSVRSFAFCWTGLMPPKSEYLAAGDASVGAWVHPAAHRRRLFLRV